MIEQQDLMVPTLGECQVTSPLVIDTPSSDTKSHFVSDSMRIRFNVEVGPEPTETDALSFEEAGPREKIFFTPAKTTAAIVTCGGLSPGLNNVIHSAVYELTQNYGIHKVLGIRNGYLGLNPQSGLQPVTLSLDYVEEIHNLGGTVLGSSRGSQDPVVMADFLASEHIDILFCMGGDGTQRGAYALYEEVNRRSKSTSPVIFGAR